MELLDYIERKINFVLGNGDLAAINRNSIGYLTRKDIEKILAEAAADAGYQYGDSVEYLILVRKKPYSS